MDDNNGQYSLFPDDEAENSSTSKRTHIRSRRITTASEAVSMPAEPDVQISAKSASATASPRIHRKIVLRPVQEPAPESVRQEASVQDPVKNDIQSEDPVKNDIPSEDPVKNDIRSEDPVKNDIRSEDPVKNDIPSEDPVKNDIRSEDPVKNDIRSEDAEPLNDIKVEIDRNELLRKQRVAALTKPVSLLETPYTVSANNKVRTRYRLEFGSAGKAIPPEISCSSDTDPNPIEELDEEAAAQDRRKEKRINTRKEIASWVFTISIAVIIALLIRTFLFVFVLVEGPSMTDTLHDNDRLFVLRVEYLFTPPERQDVIICHYPVSYSKDTSKNYVKRVIGLPGDRIRMENSLIYINDVLLDEPYAYYPDESLRTRSDQSFPERTLGEDEYFVMGDNRSNSTDSRRVGPIHRSQFVGEAKFVLFPLDRFGEAIE